MLQSWTGSQGLAFRAGRPPKKLPRKFLIVDWGIGNVVVTLYQRYGDEPVCMDSFKMTWEDSENVAEVLGERLSTELKSRKITTRDVIASVPKRQVVLKGMELPPTPAESLASVVHLQSEKLFPVPRSRLVLDFVRRPAETGSKQEKVQVAAIPVDTIGLIQGAIQHCKLKLLGCRVSEFCLPLLKNVEGDGWMVDILVYGKQVDFLASKQSLPIASFSGQAPESTGEAVGYFMSNIQRLLKSVGLPLNGIASPKIRLFGRPPAGLAEGLQRALAGSIELHTELSATQYKDHALIASFSYSEKAIDFYHFREVVHPHSTALRKKLMVLGSIIFVLCLMSLPVAWEHRRLNLQLANVMSERNLLESQVARLGTVEATWKKLAQFDHRRKDYIDEMSAILIDTPSREDFYLLSLEANESSSSGMTILRMQGKVRNREVLTKLTDDLLKESNRFRLRPPLIELDLGDLSYPVRFTLELELSGSHRTTWR